jgi:hypothetical protein
MEERRVPIMAGGYQIEKYAQPFGPQVVIKGYRRGPDELEPVNGGYMLTPGIDAEWWGQWMATKGQHMDMIKNGLVFAYEKQADVAAAAKERAKLRSGLEGIRPDELPKEITTADRR